VQVCLKIWSKLKFLTNDDNELIILLPDKQLQELALFITYGNREIPGSKILQKALK
jgi:hypothetical protein